jgi:hypothetical protein
MCAMTPQPGTPFFETQPPRWKKLFIEGTIPAQQ